MKGEVKMEHRMAAENGKYRQTQAKGKTQAHFRPARVISVLGLAATLGAAYYRFRRDWKPSATQSGEDIKDRLAMDMDSAAASGPEMPERIQQASPVQPVS
jgi:hypothetical protein